MDTTTDLALLKLLQLSSVSLPVGGFAYSQGMEYATDHGWITNYEQAKDWLSHQIANTMAWTDFIVLNEVIPASLQNRSEQLNECNSLILACRETKELKLTDTAMGASLLRVLRNLDQLLPPLADGDCSFVTVFGWAAARWQIAPRQAMLGYGWSWLENQVAAATKLVPLGQTQAQQCLVDLQPELEAAVTLAQQHTLDDVGASLPALAIASSLHETQYSRLFRS